MKIEATAKEIAALVLALQERQSCGQAIKPRFVFNPQLRAKNLSQLTEELQAHLRESLCPKKE